MAHPTGEKMKMNESILRDRLKGERSKTNESMRQEWKGDLTDSRTDEMTRALKTDDLTSESRSKRKNDSSEWTSRSALLTKSR